MHQAEGQVPQDAAPGSRLGMTVLLLSILGLVVCQFFSPLAWYLGHRELGKIRRGELAPGEEGLLKAGLIMGIVGTVLLIAGFAALAWVLYYWEEFIPFLAGLIS